MTIVTMEAVALCARFSPQGDRALEFALGLARRRRLRLNVFSFLQSPFDGSEPGLRPGVLDREARERLLVRADRELRLYYDRRLGDFVDAGFRVCEGPGEPELRRCLRRREYQVLVLPYASRGGRFGSTTIEEFAFGMPAPVVLAGSPGPDHFLLNPPAVLVAGALGLEPGAWLPLEEAGARCEAP